MIAATSLSGQPNALHWQQALADAITDPAELCAVLGLDPALVAPAFIAARDFPLRVPRGYVARMRYGDPRDRDPAMVRRDVQRGYITAEEAQRSYTAAVAAE